MSERTEKGGWQKFCAWLEPYLGRILIGVAVIFAVVVWYLGQNDGKSELIRTVVIGVIGIGGFYGLVMAKQRLDRFSKQVETQIQQADTAQEQLFSERLGRGVTLLKDNSVTMRRAGIRVLEDLGETSRPEKTELVVKIIHDFVREKAQVEYEKDKKGNNVLESYDYGSNSNPEHQDRPLPVLKEISDFRNRLDIELAVHAFAKLIKIAEIKIMDADLSLLDLRRLNFSYLELYDKNFDYDSLPEPNSDLPLLDRAIFDFGAFKGASFYKAKLYFARFFVSRLPQANFIEAELAFVLFAQSRLDNVNFAKANLRGANFHSALSKNIFFGQAILHKVEFSQAVLHGANFDSAELYGTDCTMTDFKDATGLTQKQFDTIIFLDGGKNFEPQNLPIDAKTGKQITVPKKRAYTRITDKNGDFFKQFIKSDGPWSEKRCYEWITQEIAEAEREKAKAKQSTP